MKTPWEIIAELESDNSRLFKESVLRAETKENNSIFFMGSQMALDNLVTFGIKQVPIKSSETDKGFGLEWDDFVFVLNKLMSRELTGNAARDAVEDLMHKATVDQWNNWYRRILIKDLRCGVSTTTVNNVVKKSNPEYIIPSFSCQLAHDANNYETKVIGKKQIECKLDGVRVISIVYPDGTVTQFSRNGKELLNFEHTKEALSKIANQFSQPIVFDGEIMSSSFQDLMKQVYRKEDVNASDAILNLFDMISLTEFKIGKSLIPQKTRTETLKQIFEKNYSTLCSCITVLSTAVVDLDTEQGQTLFKAYNKSAIENGYEGIMIKDPDAPYETKRTTSWLKIKPFIEVTLTVVSTEEGTGKNAGMMGALVCEGEDDGKLIQVNVGSGFTDQQRKDFWECKVDGYQIEVRADAITQNQDGTYSLRFPRFKTFRGFDLGEKL